MVLRIYKGKSCMGVFKDVERLVYTSVDKLEFKYEKNSPVAWKPFYNDKDFDSFVLSVE